ncbi:MAG: hypothetical protein ACXWC0_26995, partial [Burkholderiales bacterium]
MQKRSSSLSNTARNNSNVSVNLTIRSAGAGIPPLVMLASEFRKLLSPRTWYGLITVGRRREPRKHAADRPARTGIAFLMPELHSQ